MKLYLDSSVVIRVVEGERADREALAARLLALSGIDGGCVVSDLVYLECLVKPLALGDAVLQAAYNAFLDSLGTVALTRAVYARAAAIRAERRFETPDALHLAAAIEAGCDGFVTGDRGLVGLPDIQVIVIASSAD